MSEFKIAIMVDQHTLDVLEEKAGEKWPHFANNRSALIRNVIADWGHNQESNSKSGALKRLEENDAQEKEWQARIEQRIEAMEQSVKTLTNAMAELQMQMAHILKGEI